MKKQFIFAFIIMAVFSVSAVITPSAPCAGSNVYVIPGGEVVGIKLYTKGLLVVGMSPAPSPASLAGIKQGDIILKANGNELSDTSQLFEIVSKNDKISLECMRNSKIYNTVVIPNISSGAPRIGAWVRDSTAGLGTITFYTQDKFAALGHAVTDSDTGKIMSLSDGSITGANVVGVSIGKRGTPGELIGTFADNTIGTIDINCENGLYGKSSTNPDKQAVKIANRSEISEGDAYILANIDGSGVQQYSIKIERISLYAYTKPIIFKVTDKKLLDTTGGIVQGMSGSPIIQNNMLIGAVTHVCVNDPSRGYAIFAENMIENCQ